jgi:hypothetical protein
MSPDSRSRRSRTPPRRAAPARVRRRPSSDDAHEIVFFRQVTADDPDGRIPGREALNSYPPKVRALMRAVLVEVAAAPPKRFAGGGYWEAMRGEMAGWFEVRADGPGRRHYRLFCLLDYEASNPDRTRPLLVVVTGLDKPFRTVLSAGDYAAVRKLGEEYLGRNPRSVA